jgi:hypothetical protein
LAPLPKLNLNANLYFFAKHTLVHADIVMGMMSGATYEKAEFDVSGKAILNARISYEFVPGLQGFLSGYNLLFRSDREFFYTDRTKTVAMLGVGYEY